MKLKLGLMLMVLAISATSAFGWGAFDDIGVASSTGISADGVALGLLNYGGVNGDYIYSEAYGGKQIQGATVGRGIGVSSGMGTYSIVYNQNDLGYYRAYIWQGSLDGVGTTKADPFSTSSTNTFWARGMSPGSNSATELYVGGSRVASGTTIAARWKAPNGSVATYSQPSNFSNTNYYLYSASNGGIYAGWGRLSSSGTVANKSQACVLESGALVSLDNAWGDPSTSYYSNAYISPDAQTCFGYTGASDNSTALACFWNRGAAYTTSTVCNLIPLLPGYGKSYAMKSDHTASKIAGWTIKTGGETGVDRRTLFVYDKATGAVSDLRSILAANGVDLSLWGLMDITGISADGNILTGTMLASTDAYWTGGAVTGPYHTWVADLTKTVPEPGSMLALASGLIGLAGFGIRRRK